MGRGGHHGGGHHSGGHHGGGFHGGGGHHGGHYHGSGGHHGGVNLYYGYRLALIGILLIIALNRVFNCFNVLNVLMMVAGFALFVFASKKKGVIDAIYEFKKSPNPDYVPEVIVTDIEAYNLHGTSDGKSWYDNEDFCIYYKDKVYEKNNRTITHEKLKKWPFILKIKDTFWYIFAVLWILVNFVFYELVIPVFENMNMSDEAFAFMDEFVFYFPAIMILLSGIIVLIVTFVRLKLFRRIAIEIVDTNIADTTISREETEIQEIASEIWYYNECPNCAAIGKYGASRCRNCGTSLKVEDITLVPKDKRHHNL